jgi:hypothetical protein
MDAIDPKALPGWPRVDYEGSSSSVSVKFFADLLGKNISIAQLVEELDEGKFELMSGVLIGVLFDQNTLRVYLKLRTSKPLRREDKIFTEHKIHILSFTSDMILSEI